MAKPGRISNASFWALGLVAFAIIALLAVVMS